MILEKMLDPKDVQIGESTFKISRIPALTAQQMYVGIVKAASGWGDLGVTLLHQELATKLLSYTAMATEEGWMPLDTESHINNSIKSTDTLLELEVQMIDYNFGFLKNGGLRKILGLPPLDSDQSK